jgi:glycosyltransferase involved in cell wall biosynthesis
MVNGQRPLITIGIPTYNRPDGLLRTLQRVTKQTYENLDILVSDNASADAAAVEAVMAKFAADKRVRFVRQPVNIGSLGNFPYLVEHANGEYFCWAADDDEIELNYIEALVQRIQAHPDAALVMGSYVIEDQMAKPFMEINVSHHLHDLSGKDAYTRLKAYAVQPDHLGKSRLNWGLFKVELIRRAFRECRERIPQGQTPMWADFPIDFRLLSYGDLGVVNEIIWRVFLLPTSDGRASLSGSYKKLMTISKRWQQSMLAVVNDTELSAAQSAEITDLIKRKARMDRIQLFVYYRIIGQWPWLARQIKKLWYMLFS